MELKLNDCAYIQIRDVKTGELVAYGKISQITENPKGVSVDGIYFFNPDSDKFSIEEATDLTTYNCVKPIDEESGYTIIKNNNIDNTFTYDVFMWNDIEEEVKPIIELLNRTGFIETYSSCSGHGKIPPYVDFYVRDWDRFFDMLEFLKNVGAPSKTSKHKDIYTTHRFVIGVEGKGTVHLESTKNNSRFEQLCEVLNKYIRRQEMKQ